MVIFFSLPEALSLAETLRIPSAVTSKDTSICGTPRGAGGIPVNSKVPRELLSLVKVLSPSKTWIKTPGWLSAYVENVWDFLAGIVLLRGMSLVITPPAVSIPSERGATSSNKMSLVASLSTPVRMDAWTAAP